MWENFRKVNGNYKPRIFPPLDRGGNIITSPDEIADTFADHYAIITKDLYKKKKPGKNRNKKREVVLPYKKTFTDRELKGTPGEYTIHPLNLHLVTQQNLLPFCLSLRMFYTEILLTILQFLLTQKTH